MRTFVAAMVVSVVMSGVVSGIARGTQAPAPTTPDSTKVAAGQLVHDTQKCSTCHAIKGQGGKLSTALDGVSAKVSARRPP